MRLLCGNSSALFCKRRAHAFARLLHLGFGQPDQGEAGQSVGEVDLDRDLGAVEPVKGPTVDNCQ